VDKTETHTTKLKENSCSFLKMDYIRRTWCNFGWVCLLSSQTGTGHSVIDHQKERDKTFVNAMQKVKNWTWCPVPLRYKTKKLYSVA
jgi:hypothetical protein